GGHGGGGEQGVERQVGGADGPRGGPEAPAVDGASPGQHGGGHEQGAPQDGERGGGGHVGAGEDGEPHDHLGGADGPGDGPPGRQAQLPERREEGGGLAQLGHPGEDQHGGGEVGEHVHGGH